MEDISVVSRDAIPPISSVNQDGEVHQLGELRDFRWNDKLRNFMPDSSAFSVSWVRLGPGEVLEPHVHPIQSLMVFYEGSGQLLGDLARPVAADDVVLVPGGCLHGFVGGPDGLAALSIQFGEGLYTSPEKPRVMFADSDNTLAGLLAYNEERIKRFLERPIFTLLADGTLEDARKRKAYNDALQIWVDGNQLLLLSRQATCVDPAYQGSVTISCTRNAQSPSASPPTLRLATASSRRSPTGLRTRCSSSTTRRRRRSSTSSSRTRAPCITATRDRPSRST
jgi:mannose-6-phosphate isomerase-like protein (cupin superfamily)